MTDPPTPDHDDPPAPLIRLQAALGQAGHETADLGYEDVDDTGGVLHHAEDGNPEDPEDRILRNIASRGVGGVT